MKSGALNDFQVPLRAEIFLLRSFFLNVTIPFLKHVFGVIPQVSMALCCIQGSLSFGLTVVTCHD